MPNPANTPTPPPPKPAPLKLLSGERLAEIAEHCAIFQQLRARLAGVEVEATDESADWWGAACIDLLAHLAALTERQADAAAVLEMPEGGNLRTAAAAVVTRLCAYREQARAAEERNAELHQRLEEQRAELAEWDAQEHRLRNELQAQVGKQIEEVNSVYEKLVSDLREQAQQLHQRLAEREKQLAEAWQEIYEQDYIIASHEFSAGPRLDKRTAKIERFHAMKRTGLGLPVRTPAPATAGLGVAADAAPDETTAQP